MAGGSGEDEVPFALNSLRLALPKGYLFEDLDPHVASSFAAAIDRLSAAGAVISDITLAEIEAMRPSNNTKSIVAAEAYHLHQSNLESGKGDQYDPLIAFRIQGGKDILASEYIAVSYTHLRAHETDSYLVCRLLLEKKKQNRN